MSSRRKLLLAMGAGALAAPFASYAQQPAKVARIGFLGTSSPSNPVWVTRTEALRSGLRELGYVEGKNIHIEFRWAEERYERVPALAAELIRLKVDLIVTNSSLVARAIKQTIGAMPVIIAASGDPVPMGLAASLARPGGNFTGSVMFSIEMAAKRLELLKDAFPRVKRVAVVTNPDHPDDRVMLEAMAQAARSLKLEMQKFGVRGPGEFEGVIAAVVKKRIDALVMIDEPMLNANTGRFAEIATRNRLRSIGVAGFAEAGGLIGFGVNLVELYRRAAFFVDRILKGAKPGDIPFERATKFELVVNLRAAKALGLTIPQLLLQRADRVIE